MKCIDIWNDYQRIVEYCTKHNLYEIVKRNEDFYDGRQWEGVESDSMPKPVINILQRVVKYQIATLTSNDVAVTIKPFSSNDEDNERMKVFSSEIEKVIEQAKIKEASAELVRNAAVDGAGYMMQLFEASYETGQDMKGIIKNILVDNTNVYFGNPYSKEIQTQPYIIIALRQHIKQVRQEAKQLGLDEDAIRSINSDNDTNQHWDDSDDLVTVLIRYYKKKHVIDVETADEEGNIIKNKKTVETVFFTKSTQNVMLIEETDLGYNRYPIVCFGWDPIKNSYLYNSPLTAVIPNQIFINKCYAIAQLYGLQGAMPKIIYDKNKIHIDEFLNTTSAIAVGNIEMMGKFLDFIKIPDFSSQVLPLAQDMIQQTKECMGVSDASLGNVKPDNTSAIIALQESSNVPLELQKKSFYVMWEDLIRNLIDIMTSSYGERDFIYEKTLGKIDFSMLKGMNFELNVDIGAGSQYSEVAQINTADKLFGAGVLKPSTYVEIIPDKYILQKSKILDDIKSQEEMQERQAQMSAQQMV